MSWIQKLYETSIEIDKMQLKQEERPWPVSHMAKKAHIEISIDSTGNFKSVRELTWDEAVTIIPVTESSINRTGSKDAPHPLCEELSYCAADLPNRKAERYTKMIQLLGSWQSSPYNHPKVKAVTTYLKKEEIFKDLSENNIFPFKMINASRKKTPVEDKKVFIRWRVLEPGNPCTGTWEDESLIESWIKYDASQNVPKPGSQPFCMLSAEKVRIAKGHNRFLRTSDDGAKLISSNDSEGFTFRGRFTDGKDDSGKQACTVGYVESQKAHNTLRWLIRRQGYHKVEGEFVRCFVTWAVSCKPVPDPCANSWDFVGDDILIDEIPTLQIGDVGQSFARRFQKKLAGYKANISDTEDIVVMGLDSATPGRMAITFYRELSGSEFLERIEKWHTDFAWLQNYGKRKDKDTNKELRVIFEGAPAPKDIAWSAYGSKVEGKNGIKLLNATVERLLPSIVDGRTVPRDLVEQCVRRASNRVSFQKEKNGNQPEFEKCLGIACSLYKGFYKERGYTMALEEDRNERDYLYGRLLAVAERIESMALYLANEPRETAAARMMQRFADRPYSTWRTIETGLTPYRTRLNSKLPGLLNGYLQL
ncbi:MAG: type I-C CRISPR-associated protein Cas8c/Csd1, partial [Phycisphaerae bacterium]|nr:type I-C CRISPR-associated protein Cas8c/Csd1 [Phycisphaerae bacterium]